MPSDALSGVALVTGGGRGIGKSIARELTEAGMRVAVTGRTQEQVEAVAWELGGLGLVGDVSEWTEVESWVRRTETELGPKTRIHASSCNQDLSCLGGDCPSFVTVETAPGTGYRRPSPPLLAADALPEPARRVPHVAKKRVHVSSRR